MEGGMEGGTGGSVSAPENTTFKPLKTMNTNPDNKDRQAVERLLAEGCSCVIRNGGTMRSFHQRGVSDLWRLLHEEPELLRGAFIADKVVGKGAAALMAAGGVRGVFARTVSRPALDLLSEAGIPVESRTSSTAPATASAPWRAFAPTPEPRRSACPASGSSSAG